MHAVEVENLTKRYRLGKNNYKMLGADVRRWWARRLGRADPLEMVDDAQSPSGGSAAANDIFLALKDVSFNINQGDALGVIGTNGAGKSTLLKIISRVTLPTEGSVTLRGRILSMLEVGTGFHPDLSGRENVFLNGLILGMSRREIQRKFDEIVQFAEVEQFIDTPVKRYSSGMQVRLGFSVAAHFDPEILIIDEVLAVGDARFQLKCIEKMQGVIRSGRTILFVSHNIAAVSSLCTKGLVLDHGESRFFGTASEAISIYERMTSTQSNSPGSTFDPALAGRHIGDTYARLDLVQVIDAARQPTVEFKLEEEVTVCMEFALNESRPSIPVPSFSFYRFDRSCAFVAKPPTGAPLGPGRYRAECRIPAGLLNEGLYNVEVGLASHSDAGVASHFTEGRALEFRVVEGDSLVKGIGYAGQTAVPGAVRPTAFLKWTVDRST